MQSSLLIVAVALPFEAADIVILALPLFNQQQAHTANIQAISSSLVLYYAWQTPPYLEDTRQAVVIKPHRFHCAPTSSPPTPTPLL